MMILPAELREIAWPWTCGPSGRSKANRQLTLDSSPWRRNLLANARKKAAPLRAPRRSSRPLTPSPMLDEVWQDLLHEVLAGYKHEEDADDRKPAHLRGQHFAAGELPAPNGLPGEQHQVAAVENRDRKQVEDSETERQAGRKRQERAQAASALLVNHRADHDDSARVFRDILAEDAGHRSGDLHVEDVYAVFHGHAGRIPAEDALRIGLDADQPDALAQQLPVLFDRDRLGAELRRDIDRQRLVAALDGQRQRLARAVMDDRDHFRAVANWRAVDLHDLVADLQPCPCSGSVIIGDFLDRVEIDGLGPAGSRADRDEKHQAEQQACRRSRRDSCGALPERPLIERLRVRLVGVGAQEQLEVLVLLLRDFGGEQ